MSSVVIELDDLDRRLLEHFERRFPRPQTLSYSDYDVSPESVEILCTDPRPFDRVSADGPVIGTYLPHLRWGMFGDWRDFPAFAGFTAVWLRRHETAMVEADLGPWFLHLTDRGQFTEEDRPLIKEWVASALYPSETPITRLSDDWWMSYCLLYATLGGDVDGLIHTHFQWHEERGESALLESAFMEGKAEAVALRKQHLAGDGWALDSGPSGHQDHYIDPAAVERVIAAFAPKKDAYWAIF